MTALILQARLDSSRLPRKSLLPLGGRPLVLRVMEALSFVKSDIKVLACPEDCVSSFAPLAEEAGFKLAPGPKDDVLSRYCLVVRRFAPDRVIRATGDNPFVFVDAADSLNAEAAELGADYGLYSCIPHGTGVEVVLSEALLRAEHGAKERAEREHVCPYIYNHPELFRLHRPLAPPRWQGEKLNCTVDTPEDYERAKKLWEDLGACKDAERNFGENIIAAYRRLFFGHVKPPLNTVKNA